MTRIQKSLIAAQELGDEKLQIVNQLQELIDQKSRQLEHDFKNLDYGKDEPMAEASAKDIMPTSPSLPSPGHISSSTSAIANVTPLTVQSSIAHSASGDRFQAPSSSTNANNGDRANKRARRARTDNGNTATDTASESLNSNIEQAPKASHMPNGQNSASSAQKKAVTAGGSKKKKRKSGRGQATNAQSTNNRDDLTPPPEETIDPDEPTYCLCDQISFGEMILCDNDLCPIEWFHFSCVSLMTKPKGKWYCPNCRGDRPNCMKPKAQFLKELERYNKEKEEKT